MIMAWYRPDLYHRVLSYSGTYVNQQWPYNPETPGGAWEFHRTLIPNSAAEADPHLDARRRPRPAQPQRHARRHARLGAGQRAAWPRRWPTKGYHYQFVFARNAGHCDGAVKQQTLPKALEWLWKGYTGRTVPARQP